MTDLRKLEDQTAVEHSGERRIRSYVIRGGRMTEAQQRAFDEYMSHWGLSVKDGPCDFPAVFGNERPVVLEIGFGMGDSLAEMAAAMSEQNFVGVEVHPPGVGRLLSLIERDDLGNIRLFNADVINVLEQAIPVRSLSRINIYFPDPWHKKKHHKRRLLQRDFVQRLGDYLLPGGLLHIATDWQPYAEHIVEVMGELVGSFHNEAGPEQFSDPVAYGRPTTKFERRGQRLGHGTWDLVYRFSP